MIKDRTRLQQVVKPDPDLPDPKRLDRLRAKAGALVLREIAAAETARRREADRKAALASTGTAGGAAPLVDRIAEPDPEAPRRTILRNRVHDPLRGLLKRHEIEPAHWAAAERFREAYALAEGAREGDGGGRLEPWQRCHYAARVADARAEVRRSLEAVGLRLSRVFVAVVVQQMPLREVERELAVRNGAVVALVVEALELLTACQAVERPLGW